VSQGRVQSCFTDLETRHLLASAAHEHCLSTTRAFFVNHLLKQDDCRIGDALSVRTGIQSVTTPIPTPDLSWFPTPRDQCGQRWHWEVCVEQHTPRPLRSQRNGSRILVDTTRGDRVGGGLCCGLPSSVCGRIRLHGTGNVWERL
jgi:hypothetical protein